MTQNWDSQFLTSSTGSLFRPYALVVLAPNKITIGDFDQGTIEVLESSIDVKHIVEGGVMGTFINHYIELCPSV